jgi:4-amino-4-deoxy-L-arabinose transferase-like glycosyltransferase
MSQTADSGDHRLPLARQLLDALNDPKRRDRAAAAVILCYVALWTCYGVIAKGSQDIHADMSEQFALSRELAWGYWKHPPLTAVIVRGWFTIFPTADWAYYLLAMMNVGVTLWLVWLLSGRFLDSDKRVAGLALLTLVPFFNFHALRFNANAVLLPLWAATTLAFLQSFETRRITDAALAGITAAAAMYGKYWSIMLLLGLGFAALVDSRRSTYFRSPAPWVTIAVGSLMLAPHVAWLLANDLAPFSYARMVHGATSMASQLGSVLRYLIGAIGYVMVPLVAVLLAARPSRDAVADMIWPLSPRRRFAALAFWATLLVPPIVATFLQIELSSLWTMSAWTLLPVILLSSPLLTISRRDATRLVTLAIIFPLVMIAVAPAIAFNVHRSDHPPGITQTSRVAEPIEQLWRQTSNQPLRLFAAYDEFTDGVSFYMRDHPVALHVIDILQRYLVDYKLSGTVKELITHNGLAMMCPARTRSPPDAEKCMSTAAWIANQFPAGMQEEFEVNRRYLGIDGKPARYLLITIPPRQ